MSGSNDLQIATPAPRKAKCKNVTVYFPGRGALAGIFYSRRIHERECHAQKTIFTFPSNLNGI